MKAVSAVLAGAALLAWPALLNGFPLVYIDTVSYLGQTVMGEWPWDKTPAYGAFLHLFHWRLALWPAVAAQALIGSHLVWLAQRMVRGEATPLAHLLVCAVLATLSSAPWFLAALMPDAFTALAPLCLLLLGFGRLRAAEAAWVTAIGALAIAAHLSHLPVALAMLALVALLGRRVLPLLRAGLPVALAVLGLLAANVLVHGRATLSPHGVVFLLARLQADGPAVATLRERCPVSGWHLCGFIDRMPIDSDEFLWDGESPLNRNLDGSRRPMGGELGAPDARAIVAATLRDRPFEVAGAMLRNTLAQIVMVQVGDTLVDTYLSVSARRPIAAAFPPREVAAFDAGAQMRGVLPERAAPFLWPHVPALLAALALAPFLLWRAARRRDLPRAALLAGALLALPANAFATGALSGPHDRYQARIAWLLPLSVTLALLPGAARLSPPRPRPSADRTMPR